MAKNHVDSDGNPAGGYVTGVGLGITWQNGPLGRGADRATPNGCFVETVLEAARQRLEFYQEASGGKFMCGENQRAIWAIEKALWELESRTAQREERQVEGTHQI